MQFKIVGANAESGDDVDVMLDAPSQTEVERIAHDRGILVASITPLAAHAPAHAAPEAHAPAAHAKKEDLSAISLIDDEPPAADPAHPGNGHAAPHAERPHGLITTNANTPGDTAHTGDGHIAAEKHNDSVTQYHIIMNQSLYLLETAVNRHLKDGWEAQGGLSVGMSNNALQFFQSMIKRPVKPAHA